jgi:hypothetical protein
MQKQYNRFDTGYFRNFVRSHDPEDIMEEALAPYKATIVKSNVRPHWSKITIDWHDEQLYTLFVLRWS